MEPDDVEFAADMNEYNTRHVYELNKAFTSVRAVLDDARLAYKRYYDRNIPGHAKRPAFAVGDEVMLFSPRLRAPNDTEAEVAHRKLTAKWNGPFTIVQISNTDDVYTIRDASNRLLRVKVHDLKTYHTPMDEETAKSVSKKRSGNEVSGNAEPKRRRTARTADGKDEPQAVSNDSQSATRIATRVAVDVEEDANRSYLVDRVLSHR